MRPVTSACALITRQSAKARHRVGVGDLLDEGLRVDRREQAAALQIVGDDAGDVARDLGFGRRAGDEIGQRDRHRLQDCLA